MKLILPFYLVMLCLRTSKEQKLNNKATNILVKSLWIRHLLIPLCTNTLVGEWLLWSSHQRHKAEQSLLKILILLGNFVANLLKKFARKDFFLLFFSKNFNWQVIPSWAIISYKIMKFASISYKICCEKCFIQNILQKNWQQFPADFFS